MKHQYYWYCLIILLSAAAGGIIVTGGGGIDAGSSVEVILSNGSLCTLPSLPGARNRHSQSGLTACGGQDSTAQDTCTTFSNGAWTTSHHLDPFRKSHVSWNSPSGLMLLGGASSMQTTSLLSSTTSSVSDQFELLYNTK